ncbi:dTMP kinase [Desulfobulbus rhabdoformis]|uniref:dTMP kinase n=1 Tax=Desulfobulbus rhabdoformis TaxID=34032 RepID=UPI0019628BB1|nr:dTMP kinase [Desulfobulbus rhabdoformis]MBM9612745.1 dTMP kinase [Desulfobulbus rhabdoformis]
MKRGVLIAFEGIDGTGKSTQLPLLAAYLRSLGHTVVETREPTEGEYGRRIRALYTDRGQVSLEEELELFIQDRKEHIQNCIEPALQAGQIVLTDRYYFSTAAYQGAAGLDAQAIFRRHAFAPEPDRVLLLTQTPAESVQRIQGRRGEELNDFEQLDQLEKVANLFASFSQDCIVRIPAAKSIEQVQMEIREAISPLLAEHGGAC